MLVRSFAASSVSTGSGGLAAGTAAAGGATFRIGPAASDAADSICAGSRAVEASGSMDTADAAA